MKSRDISGALKAAYINQIPKPQGLPRAVLNYRSNPPSRSSLSKTDDLQSPLTSALSRVHVGDRSEGSVLQLLHSTGCPRFSTVVGGTLRERFVQDFIT